MGQPNTRYSGFLILWICFRFLPRRRGSTWKTRESHLNAGFHARGGSVVQGGVFLVVGGVDVSRLVLAVVQLRPRPRQRQLEALGPPPLVFVRPRQPRLQRPLGGQDLGAHAEEVQGRLVVHVPLVRIPVFVQEEESGGRRDKNEASTGIN